MNSLRRTVKELYSDRRLSLSHSERIRTCLAGDKPDVTPVALWRHFPVDDQYPDKLAAAIASFQDVFDFDLIKVTPASSFCVRDWGCQDEWRGNPEGTREYTHSVIKEPGDWEKLSVLDPKKGFLSKQLECLKQLFKVYSPATPILQTIFSPLSQAKNLVGKANLISQLRKYPEAVLKGLETIQRTTMDFIEACIDLKINGFFYAVQHAQKELLTVEEFLQFGKSIDIPILSTFQSSDINILHAHGENIMFSELQDYPVPVINWHDQHTEPSLQNGKKLSSKTVCGGLKQWETLVLGNPTRVSDEARAAITSTNGTHFILGTGCVVPVTAPFGNLMAARLSVLETE
jgi:uroporphyrinogen decarboxylase